MNTQLQLTTNPHEYFHERVSSALQHLRVEVDDHVEFYLVNLLCDFINPEKINNSVGDVDILSTPLALMLKQAVESPVHQRIKIFKCLGDTSLYFAGFFQDHFNRKTYDIGYYITLGASAYNNVSALVRDQSRDENLPAIYQSLSNNFVQLVDVVAEIASLPANSKPVDILAVYDRWTRSNSERLRRVLEQNGITPVEIRTKLAQ